MRSIAFAFCGALILLAGCFETHLTLGPADKAVVDLRFVGDWRSQNKDLPEEAVNIIIRNIDGKQYYVEYSDDKPGEPHPQINRMTGYTAEINGVAFAHLRGLSDDGTLAEKHLLMRVELKDGKLMLRNLNDEFFKANPPKTDADLRARVAENLENAQMYDAEPVIAARVAAK